MAQYLDLDGAAETSASTPDHADFTVTDLDVRMKFAFDTYDSKAQRPFEKWSDNGAFLVQLGDDGIVYLEWHDGSSAQSLEISNPGWVNGTQYWLKVTLDVDDGAGDCIAKFYRSTDTGDDHTAVSFSQIGGDQALGSTSAIRDGDGAAAVSREGGGPFGSADGKIFQAVFLDGIGGSVAAHFNAADFTVGEGDTDTAVDVTGKTWTIHGANSEIMADPAPALVSELITAIDPVVATSSPTQDLTPTLASQLVAGVDPTVTPGAVDFTPALVTELLTATDPTVTPGAVDIAASLVSQLVAGVDPVVGPPGLTPALVTELVAAVDPVLTVGAVDISPSLVSQLVAGVDPVVALDTGQTLSPDLVSQLLAGVDPTVTPGAVDLSPLLVTQLVAGVDPTVTIDTTQTLTAALVTQLLAAVDPALTTGPVDLTPSLVSQLLAAVDPALSIDLSPSLVTQLLTAVDPTLTTGVVDLSPALVTELLTAIDPTVIQAGLFFWEGDPVGYTDDTVTYTPLEPATPNPL